MKLATKLTLAVSAVFAGVLVVIGALVATDEIDFTDAQADVHQRLLGEVVGSMAREAWKEGGEQEARKLVQAVDRREPRISVRWVRLDDQPDLELPPEKLKALDAGQTVGRVSPEDESTLLTLVPMEEDGVGTVIEISEPLDVRDAHIGRLSFHLVLVGVLGTLLACLLAYLLGRRMIGAPIDALVEKARRVGRGDLGRTDEVAGYPADEIGYLRGEIDRMIREIRVEKDLNARQEAQRKEMEAQLRHADRLATIGQLAAGVAHEIGTPLQAVTAGADVLIRRSDDPESVARFAGRIKEEARRISSIVRNLLSFARKRPPDRARVDLRDVVHRSRSLVEHAVGKRALRWIEDVSEESLIAEVDHDQLDQVMTNLVMNGVQAMPNGGSIRIGAERRRQRPPANVGGGEGDYFCLYVEDQGEGIPPDVVPRIFDPFFTTKADGKGTGLGLSIVYGIVREHGGWIDVQSEVGRGSRFFVYLPPPGDESKLDLGADLEDPIRRNPEERSGAAGVS